MEDKKSNHWSSRRIIIILAGLLVIALLFSFAMFVIEVKTSYIHRWSGEQYFGEIVEISGNSFVIKGRSNDRKTVLITDRTIVKKGIETVRDDLRIGDRVIIVGSLNKEGQIEAQLIRIFNPGDPIDPQKFFQSPFLR